jgi:hypothetical protein
MGVTGITDRAGLYKKINILCLLAAFAIIFFLPAKKEIWYDETVSLLCSKGISHDAPLLFANTNTVSSATLEQLNTGKKVFDATVNDNANSYLYNISLHWFTMISGNSLMGYMLLSKLLAIGTLIALWFLCLLFLPDSIFAAVAILLLAVDIDFLGMSHEIRAYSMAIFFVTLAAIYFFKFMYRAGQPVFLFLAGLFSVAAVLSHFLSVYIILVLLGALILRKKTALLSAKNLLAMAIPVALIAAYFFFAYPGLQTMSKQNHDIQQNTLAAGFSISEVAFRAMKFTAIDLKAAFPAFKGSRPVILISFLFVIALYFAGIKAATSREQKVNLRLLFWLSAGSSVFLALLCIKSHHYTALYYRYFSFCLPFCSLYVAYLLSVFYSNERINKLVTTGLSAILIITPLVLFASAVKHGEATVRYNHPIIARLIASNGINKIEVPQWRDAFIIHSLLPAGYKIDYFRNPASTAFTLYNGGNEEKIPVIRIEE